MSGKGDKRRPTQVPREDFESNWDRIFCGKPNETSMLELNKALKEKNSLGREKKT